MYQHLSNRQFAVLKAVAEGKLKAKLGEVNQTTLGSLFYRELLSFHDGRTSLSEEGKQLYGHFVNGSVPMRKSPGDLTDRVADMLRRQARAAFRIVKKNKAA